MKRYIYILAAALALAGCNEEIAPEIVPEGFIGVIDDFAAPTKTSLAEGNYIAWSEDDRIAVFQGSIDPDCFRVSDASVGNTRASFEAVSTSGSNGQSKEYAENVAVYPYNSNMSCLTNRVSGGTVLSYTIKSVFYPVVQTYKENSFPADALVMAAVTDDLADRNLRFKAAGAVLRFKVKGAARLASITVFGNSGESLSGTAAVGVNTDGSAPTVSMTNNSNSVTLDCGSGVALNESEATVFMLCIPPTQFESGFTVSFADVNGEEDVRTVSKSINVQRGHIFGMSEITFGQPSESTSEYDYIDENGINRGPGVEIDGVVWAPVNCGYHETDFKYGKLYQWGRKYGQGYDGGLYDADRCYLSDYSDASVPEIVAGTVPLETGQSKANEYNFYYNSSDPYNWCDSQNNKLWNSGTMANPVKTEYDPCPEGWRVPTNAELRRLKNNYSSWTSVNGQTGIWFSGSSSYSPSASQVFLPAAGYRVSGYSVRCVKDDGELIPVSDITLDKTSLSLEVDELSALSAAIAPADANHQFAYWWSEDPSIATVDQNGTVTAVSAGTTTITAMAGMQTATCEVTVAAASNQKNYIDEYGVNHGPGVEIDGVVWAPVNCGYHETDFKYGKLYQWGRKYGQGYSGSIYDLNGKKTGTYSDSSVPTAESGPVSLNTGQSKSNENDFYKVTSSPYNWLSEQKDDLWNSGDEKNPVKTDNDPCPDGWRVPTYAQLNNLKSNCSSWTENDGQVGCWFSGSVSYATSSPRVFFPAAGYRYYDGPAYGRCSYGGCWSSRPYHSSVYYLAFDYSGAIMSSDYRAYGFSVRCVQE